MKVLNCSDVGFECPGIIRAENEDEVLRQAAEHARDAHDTEVSPELIERVKSAIRDEPA